MCLKVSKPRDKNRTVAYKLVKRPRRLDDSYIGYHPIFKVGFYELGKMFVSDRDRNLDQVGAFYPKEITKSAFAKAVNLSKGIHVYTDLNVARVWKKDFNSSNWGEASEFVILECAVLPEDWVADGRDDEALYYQVKPVKEIN